MPAIPSHIPDDERVGTQLLFEDDDVRIWSIVLEPGQTARLHTHRLDYCVMTVKGGRNRRGNGDGRSTSWSRVAARSASTQSARARPTT